MIRPMKKVKVLFLVGGLRGLILLFVPGLGVLQEEMKEIRMRTLPPISILYALKRVITSLHPPLPALSSHPHPRCRLPLHPHLHLHLHPHQRPGKVPAIPTPSPLSPSLVTPPDLREDASASASADDGQDGMTMTTPTMGSRQRVRTKGGARESGERGKCDSLYRVRIRARQPVLNHTYKPV
jgi:hypothetical protein